MVVDRFIGVADIANVRFSLPAQLLEPVPNLGMLPENGQDRKKRLQKTDSEFRVLDIYRSTGNVCEHWRFRRLPWTYAGGIEVLVHKGFGASLGASIAARQLNLTYRNLSRASPSSHTTRH